jgi:hypothetical protein
MIGLGLKQNTADECLFTALSPSGLIIMVSLYVDDLAVTGNDIQRLREFKIALFATFKMSDLGQVGQKEKCLGHEIAWTDLGIHLHQSMYVYALLEEWSSELEIGTVSTPLRADVFQSLVEAKVDISYQKRIAQVIGKLWWLVLVSRFDIHFAVYKLSCYQQRPSRELWGAVLRVLQYLAGCPTRGILFRYGPVESGVSSKVIRPNAEEELQFFEAPSVVSWSDASHLSDVETMHATVGFAVALWGCLISWGCKKLDRIYLSTAGSEYAGASFCTAEVLFVQALLGGIAGDVGSSVLALDNAGAVAIARGTSGKRCIKYVVARHRMVQEAVQCGELEIVKVASSDMYVDFLTKVVGPTKFWHCVGKLSGYVRTELVTYTGEMLD